MAATLPTPQRKKPALAAEIWKIPHKPSDERLYPFGIYHHPNRWEFSPVRPVIDEEAEESGKAPPWPKLGEFLPSMEVLRYIPGVGGEPDPKGSPFSGGYGPTSRHAGLVAKGWIHIPSGDPRIDEDLAWYEYTLEGAAGTLQVLPWDIAERRGVNDVAWHTDHAKLLAYRRALTKVVPRMTIAAYNALLQDLHLQRERRRDRASRSDMARDLYRDTDQLVRQCERTWAAYVDDAAPAAVRITPTRKGA